MLWFIGFGISDFRGISLEALEILKKCSIIYFEKFTSLISQNDIDNFTLLLNQDLPVQGKKISIAKRWMIEDGRQIIEQAKHNEVAIVSYGDPMIATTHSELRVRAMRNNVSVRILHSASGISSLIGETGLHFYKFGRTVTMMSEVNSSISVYNAVHDNLRSKNHTLILTEYNLDENSERAFYLDPAKVMQMLLDAEKNLKYNVISMDTFLIVASRIGGTTDQKITSGTIKNLISLEFGDGPHSIIVTGPLHFTEIEAVSAVSNNLDPPSDNSSMLTNISAQMIKNYVPKAKEALQNLRSIIDKEQKNGINRGAYEVLDNAEYYLADAERFLFQGKQELAVLCVGYAEGLIDSLRYQKGINPWK